MTEIHIVGTAHVSNKSVEEVIDTVNAVNPDVIAIELDQGRFATLKKQMREEEAAANGVVYDSGEGKAPEVKSILSGNFMVMIVQWLLAYVQRKIGLNVGVEPGAEMKAAIRLAEERGIRILLIDRDINTTLARFWGGMKFFEKIKLIWVLVRSVFGSEDETDELDAVTIDSLTNQNMIDAALKEFRQFSPAGAHALIDERDAYLAHGVVSLERSSFERAVVVCGAGHVPGITRYRENPETLPPMSELTALPKKYPWGKILGGVFLAMFLIIILAVAFSGATELLIWAIVFWVVLHAILAGAATLLARGHPLSAAVSAVLAWMTSINPFLACGWFAALVEAKMRLPTAKDFKAIGNAESISEMFSVPLFRILLVAAASNIGASIATISFFVFFGPVFGVDLEMMTNILVTGFTNLWEFIISPFKGLF